MQVPFYRHSLKPEDAASVAAVLGTPFLTSGSVGRAVEAQLCAYFGVRHALLVNSWTNGAAAALLALGIGPGDEVIVPAQTFIATANVTCGEGGAIVTNDSSLYERLQQTRLHGMSAGAIDRFKHGSYRHWDMVRMGMKANLPDLLACLLPKQIETVDERLPLREEI